MNTIINNSSRANIISIRPIRNALPHKNRIPLPQFILQKKVDFLESWIADFAAKYTGEDYQVPPEYMEEFLDLLAEDLEKYSSISEAPRWVHGNIRNTPGNIFGFWSGGQPVILWKVLDAHYSLQGIILSAWKGAGRLNRRDETRLGFLIDHARLSCAEWFSERRAPLK